MSLMRLRETGVAAGSTPLTTPVKFPDLSHWAMAPVFAYEDPIPTLPLHFNEHFLLVTFGATELAAHGMNVNLFDSFTRECIVSNKVVLKILVAMERLLEAYPNAGFCWPTAEDKAAWDSFLEPVFPEGIPITPIRMSIILNGTERRHLHALVNIPKVEELCQRRRTSVITREDGSPMMSVPVSAQHLRLHNIDSVPMASNLHPAKILERVCAVFHPFLREELAQKTTSRDRKRVPTQDIAPKQQ